MKDLEIRISDETYNWLKDFQDGTPRDFGKIFEIALETARVNNSFAPLIEAIVDEAKVSPVAVELNSGRGFVAVITDDGIAVSEMRSSCSLKR